MRSVSSVTVPDVRVVIVPERITSEDFDALVDEGAKQARTDSYWRSNSQRLQRQLEQSERQIEFLTAVDDIYVTPAKFKVPAKSKRAHKGIVNLVLSDLHFDEVVKPEQVNHLNAYNREIALMRLQATIDKTIMMAYDYTSGIEFDGIQVWLGGDNLSGNIHDELNRTNEGQHVVDSIDYWSDKLAGALARLADAFGAVHVTCQYGNHGRSSKKPEAKDAIRSSFDWLLYRMVARGLRNDVRITWNMPESLLVVETIYGSTYLFEHGDNFRGGDQVAGPIRPVMMGASKRKQTIEFDRMIVGHFHRYADIPQAIMNGSMIGYNEYAHRKGFGFEPPKQAFWIETPENGPINSNAILPADPKAEGWR